MPDHPTLDPYAVLGVPRDASPLQVARAHRRLAKRYHPDLGAEGDAERMRRINEAWATLSAPARRHEFDRQHPVAAPPPGGHWAASRRPINPSPANTTRTWASWRATAAETRAAPRTVRQPGEVRVTPTRRPPAREPEPRTFRDSGWAALAVAAVLLLLLLSAIVLGKI
ncbi:MAG TPA: J domain-containing protein [Candidatus Limnocylindria bacterium]|nr:J domain-containing protein [Candidatus Limnocylindria bacterium]